MWHRLGRWAPAAAAAALAGPPYSTSSCMDWNYRRYAMPPAARLAPVWERGITPRANQRVENVWQLGRHIAMMPPPPIERVRPRQVPDQEGVNSLDGEASLTSSGKKRKIAWPKEQGTVEEEKEKEIHKWKTVIELAGTNHSGLARQIAAEGTDEGRRRTITKTFYPSAPTTLARHAGAMSLYIRWCMSMGKDPFPMTEPQVFDYVCFLQEVKAPPTRAETFIKGAKFATTVLNLFSGHDLLASKRIEGAVDENLDRKRDTVQAPPLPVGAVLALERTVMNEGCSRSVRIVAGFALFCVGGRLRHGDATRIMKEPVIEPEAVMKHGRGHGFIEAERGVTKTNQTRARKRWKVPMVSHSWRLSTEEWGPTWLKLRAKAKLNAATDGTLLPRCGPDWSLVPRTRMTSDTMTLLLREIVAMSEPDLDMSRITSHSMKTTLLSWVCNSGLSDDARRALGGHSKPGDDMVRLYGRDFLAEPMRQLAHVLLWVADGDFDPGRDQTGKVGEAPGHESQNQIAERVGGGRLCRPLWGPRGPAEEAKQASLSRPPPPPRRRPRRVIARLA